jgi:uncharacterized membrane protein YkoI
LPNLAKILEEYLMKSLIIAALLAAPIAVSAAEPSRYFKDCSMKAAKTAKKTDLLAMAKVKEDEAKKIAMGGVSGASIVKGGIETENGCLVYSYHVKDPAKSGQTEVFVDAGDGKILKTEKEGAVRTALEKPVDKTKELAGKAKEKMTGEPSTNQAVKK